MTEPYRLDATEALQALRDRTLTADALASSCFARIAERDGVIGAFAHLDPQAALRRARTLDETADRTGLCGLPVGVKDIIDTVDMPTAYGSLRYAGHQPTADAAIVHALRLGGAVFPGKTATTEFAGAHPAQTRNPRNVNHSPGGSSAGSAAAVADYMLPVAIGTQTAGSVIRPAAFCGVVGFKPSFGQIPTNGIRPAAQSFDTVGTFGRTVADAALLLPWLSRDRSTSLDLRQVFRPRIGLCRSPAWSAASEDVQAALEAAAARLARAGATIVDQDLPPPFDAVIEAQSLVMSAETYRSTRADLAAGHTGLTHATIAAARLGEAVTPLAEQAARAVLAQASARFAAAFGECDVLLSPSQVDEAPEGIGSTGDPVFSRLWSALGVPCITLPFTTGRRGMPIGMQVIAPAGQDAKLLAAAVWMEAALGARVPAAERS